MFAFAAAGGGALTPETFVTEDAQTSVAAAAGAVLEATRQALAGQHEPSLCVWYARARHQAGKNRGGGTYLINNLAVAAADALHRGVRSVAMSTSTLITVTAPRTFSAKTRVFSPSPCHQAEPFFPGTGSKEEIGRGRGRGSNLMPGGLQPTTGRRFWRKDWCMYDVIVRNWFWSNSPPTLIVPIRPPTCSCPTATSKRLPPLIESLGGPGLFKRLGACLSERAWVGGVRALVEASSGHR